MGHPSERRTFPRHRIQLPVQIKLQNYDEFVSQYITDISAGGVFIATPTPYEIGNEIDVEFYVGENNQYFFKVRGVVSRLTENPRGMGVQFTKIEKRSQEILDDILNKLE